MHFPAHKVIFSVVQNSLGSFKTRGEGRGGGEEKSTYTAEAFMIYNWVHTAFAIIPHLTARVVRQ